jgi:hypothetical protein
MAAARAIQLLDWDGPRWLNRWWMKSGEWVSSLDAILVVDIGPVPVDLPDISSTRSHMMCRGNSIRCHLYLMSPHLVPISIPRHMINICLNLNPIHYPHMCSVLALSTLCHTLQAYPRITCLTKYFDTLILLPASTHLPSFLFNTTFAALGRSRLHLHSPSPEFPSFRAKSYGRQIPHDCHYRASCLFASCFPDRLCRF